MECPILILLPTLRPAHKWEGLVAMLREECRAGDEVRVIIEPGGYWNVMNKHLPTDSRAPVLCFQDDTRPRKGFLDIARAAWLEHYPDGTGLIALNDENVCQGGATYPMMSKTWLWVLFGHEHFHDFWHNYLDTLMADRSKDLGRYTYVPEAVCRHMHYSLGLSEQDDISLEAYHYGKDDYVMKNSFDKEWRGGGFEKALERMRLAGGRTPERSQPVTPPSPPKPPKVAEPGLGKWFSAIQPHIQSLGQSKQSGRK